MTQIFEGQDKEDLLTPEVAIENYAIEQEQERSNLMEIVQRPAAATMEEKIKKHRLYQTLNQDKCFEKTGVETELTSKSIILQELHNDEKFKTLAAECSKRM